MNFAHQVRTDIAAGVAGVLAGVLQLTESLDSVIGAIDEQVTKVKPERFKDDAEIISASFGAAANSPLLAYDYSRAHTVTHGALKDAKEDLVQFREACLGARRIIKEADEDAAARSGVQRRALDQIVEGTTPFLDDAQDDSDGESQ